MDNLNLLNETFNLYFNKAKECMAGGKQLLAKKYYVLAAEQMIKMAKASDGKLREARYARAKSILQFSEGLAAGRSATDGAKKDSFAPSVQPAEKISLEEALSRLSRLEGLSGVKAQVRDWVDQIKVFQLRKSRNMAVPDMSYHLVFTGNPGTGKTTVARLMSQIYCALGILSQGHLVEVDRSALVAGYVGQTAIKTKEVLKSAYGGVLFIDEAYTLAGGGSNDFGQEAIDTILKEMEDRRDDLVVICAGYSDLMQKFINSNPGLRSRFKNFIHFDDYTGRELTGIFLGMCASSQYVVDEDAARAISAYFSAIYARRDRNFGNGREVRNLFEKIVTAQSGRVLKIKNPTDDQLCRILYEDLPANILEAAADDKTAQDGKPAQGKINGAAEDGADCRRADGGEQGNGKTDRDSSAVGYKKDGKSYAGEGKELAAEQKVLKGAEEEFSFEWDTLPSVTFDDIAGLEDVKQAVKLKVLLPLSNPEVFEGYERKSGGGLLLYGPPGTGKTMVAAAIAREIGAKFCSVKPSDLLNQGVGNTEKAVRALFAEARSFPCAVICFDEMDSISPKSTRSQYARQLRSELLAQLQGTEAYGGEQGNILFLIAATNKPWDVDGAFLRPGRFGTKIYVGLPDEGARRYLIERRLDKLRAKGIVQVDDDIDLDGIVADTQGFNGADVVNLLDRAEELSALRAMNGGGKRLSREDFSAALGQISSSVQSEDIQRLLEWKRENDR